MKIDINKLTTEQFIFFVNFGAIELYCRNADERRYLKADGQNGVILVDEEGDRCGSIEERFVNDSIEEILTNEHWLYSSKIKEVKPIKMEII